MSNGTFQKPNYLYKRFRVRRADGQSTTVSVSPNLVVAACQTMGSLASVSKVVREAAIGYDEAALGKNRSAHVSAKLKEIVSQGRQAQIAASKAASLAASQAAAA